MKKVRVQFVKYDLSKTKGRKRRDLLVDDESQDAVIAQLEKIHKGERVVAIHELVWDELQIEQVKQQIQNERSEVYLGTVKFFEVDKGFGFIVPDEDMDDLFFHASACEQIPGDRDRVEFKISEGPKGLSAIKVKLID